MKKRVVMVDQLVRATAADGGIRAVGVITTRLVEEARVRHGLSYVATAALGRAMSGSLLLASSMKQPQARINLRIKGNGPLGEVFVDAGVDGTVRGYVGNPDTELPLNSLGKLDVGAAVGPEGFLYVIRDIGYGYPYSSTVELVSGEIGDDITYYLATSEQTPSALILGVFVDSSGVTAAGGLLIQVMPKASEDEELVKLLESRISHLSGFTPLLKAGQSLPHIFEELLGDVGLVIFPDTQLLQFQCKCSMNRMLGALKLLSVDELQDMIQTDNGAEVTCDLCGETYQATRQNLDELVQDLMQGKQQEA